MVRTDDYPQKLSGATCGALITAPNKLTKPLMQRHCVKNPLSSYISCRPVICPITDIISFSFFILPLFTPTCTESFLLSVADICFHVLDGPIRNIFSTSSSVVEVINFAFDRIV